MYPEKRLWDLWELDLSLFKGISETPEAMYDTEFRSYHETRLSRGSTGNGLTDDLEDNKAKYLCDLEFNIDKLEYKEIKE